MLYFIIDDAADCHIRDIFDYYMTCCRAIFLRFFLSGLRFSPDLFSPLRCLFAAISRHASSLIIFTFYYERFTPLSCCFAADS